jgi:hypothetical protein
MCFLKNQVMHMNEVHDYLQRTIKIRIPYIRVRNDTLIYNHTYQELYHAKLYALCLVGVVIPGHRKSLSGAFWDLATVCTTVLGGTKQTTLDGV